ncbi:MAG: hypothetical protein B7Y86_15310 [Brevundimonas subvibrioides]|uniref:Lipoprotein n=1 Tax=Brevundimonas subvibrioides TaxID=74313 RepID=A0A258HEU5_9CAUL|nr:hypothetical protein [Brevundimonas subvibrioides]OYX54873.1 MAG: hypothetical protein B7Y86_15310 [Brevundimonas subvibrioides]
MKIRILLAASVLALSVAACDTSALQDLQDTAAKAEATLETVNTRTAQVQQAIDNPGGALLAAVGATFSKTATDQPGVYVLTDLQTGCQFLGTYGPDGTTVSSIAPRVEAAPGGGTQQRCVAIPGVARPEAAEAEAEG